VYDSLIEENNKKIGYLQVTSFSNNTYKQFEMKLKKLEKDNIQSLIIDVRDNPGGQLLQTKDILSLFFPKDTVLYQIESKNSKIKVRSTTKESRSYPIAVLINSNSASASEILASCFQERYKKAIIVGSTSYGKGTVQKSQNLSSGTSIKFTTQKWLTSKGKWLEKNGIVPDFVVNQSEEYYQETCMENDAQLQEAITQIKES
jgi:carboxyl-terminal processing protease